MFKVLLFATCVLLVKGQYGQYGYPQSVRQYGQYGYPQSGDGQPNPYEFSYSNPAEGGSSSHQESGDGQGRVQGSYTVTDDDGRTRTVEYTADENGFKANIVTNEPGTSNLQPADVTISSTADQEAGQYAPAPAQYAPAPRRYAPQPRRYAPQPIQYAPQPYQYAPQPIQYAPQPVQYAPAPAYGNYGGGSQYYGGGPQYGYGY